MNVSQESYLVNGRVLTLMRTGVAVDFSWPVGDVIEFDGIFIVRLEPDPGSFFKTTTAHQAYSKQLHGLIEGGRSFRNDPILNKQYNDFRSEWWRSRADDFK